MLPGEEPSCVSQISPRVQRCLYKEPTTRGILSLGTANYPVVTLSENILDFFCVCSLYARLPPAPRGTKNSLTLWAQMDAVRSIQR